MAPEFQLLTMHKLGLLHLHTGPETMGSVAVIPDCSGSAFVTVLILCIVGWLSLLALAAKVS
jgi:hypothetical protein